MDPVGQKLLHIARTELGYSEKSSGYTKYGNWYGEHVAHGGGYDTAPWCDMFLAWAADKAGVEDWTGEFASTPDHASWFQKHHAWGHNPEPGAIVFFSFSGGKSIGDIEHVGIVEKVHGDKLTTIEANHNNKLGRADRDVSQVVGFGYPAKVKVKGKPVPGTEQKYQPKHSAPALSPREIVGDVGAQQQVAQTSHAAPEQPLVDQSGMLTGLLAVVVFGTATLAIARSRVKVPVPASGVQLRKRGKHHRRPVELPAEMTPAHLDEADVGTAVMPAFTAEAAAQAEDREFWGRISALEEDEELAFWDSMHSVMASARPSERASAMAGM
ncbi:CHAP domain-containing protein [Actinoallomurus sp. NBC_01490]|uniref:CHAP domain-containing protein n=1 Tax=Actinoallomurus sp. NBC_01490 TaxID=2903557 RepID=UPI002E32F0F6|nr:CHAP domain-containing protein [Actinoallomurus sp. NBC_01490]